MAKAKCGCRMWETRSGDTEEYICPMHSGKQLCFIGDIEGCKHFHIEGDVDDPEYWCEHPDLDQSIEGDYCPLIVENIMEEWDD